MDFLTKKTFESIKEVGNNSGLSKTLGPLDLILFGLGGIIGTGVFVLTGLVAARYSGPAIMISYVIAGCTCILVALAYTELATMLPTSGSIYSYSYVAYGKLFAWMVGFGILILEFCISSGAVASGWSGYVQGILAAGGVHLPTALAKCPSEGGVINLPAVLIVLFVGSILMLGNKESKKLNAILVLLKIGAIATFILTAAPHFDSANWKEFMPFGFNNVIIGASILFLAFTGFGTIAATAEECKNPKRDIMIGIIGSLVISTIIYVIVGGLATGITSYKELDNAQPLAHALNMNNSNIGSAIVAVGAVCGMTTVIMMNIYGISRIFYVMARDGLLPRQIAILHPKYDTPYYTIIIFTALAAILGGLCPLQLLGQLSSMAALIDYIVIISIVLVFRYTLPNAQRPFKCPAIFVIAPIALLATTYLLLKQIFGEHGELLLTGQILFSWFGVAFLLYLLRGMLVKG